MPPATSSESPPISAESSGARATLHTRLATLPFRTARPRWKVAVVSEHGDLPRNTFETLLLFFSRGRTRGSLYGTAITLGLAVRSRSFWRRTAAVGRWGGHYGRLVRFGSLFRGRGRPSEHAWTMKRFFEELVRAIQASSGEGRKQEGGGEQNRQ